MRNDRKSATLFVLCCSVMFFTLPAYGYADPNTVGLLSQMLTPLLLTAAAAFTVFRKQVGKIFTALAHCLRRRDDAPEV